MGKRREEQRLYRANMRELCAGSGNVFEEEMCKAKLRILLKAIRLARGNFCDAAIYLGIHRNTLRSLLKQIGLTGAQVKQWVRQDAAQQERAA